MCEIPSSQIPSLGFSRNSSERRPFGGVQRFFLPQAQLLQHLTYPTPVRHYPAGLQLLLQLRYCFLHK